MNTLWVCVLSCLLSIVAYAGISNALSSAAQPAPETQAAPSASAAEDFSEYLHLHMTRSEGSFVHPAASASACTE